MKFVATATGLFLLSALVWFIGCQLRSPAPVPPPTDSTPRPSPLPKTLTLKLSEEELLEFVLIDPAAQPDGGTFEFQGSSPAKHAVRMAKPYYLGRTEVTVGQFRTYTRQTGRLITTTSLNLDDKEKGKTEPPAPLPSYRWSDTGFPRTESHPVGGVDGPDAAQFAEWVSGNLALHRQVSDQLGSQKWQASLPSEAEWEYACRAGSTTPFSFASAETQLIKYGNVRDLAWMKKYTPTAAQNQGNVWVKRNLTDGFADSAPVAKFDPNGFGLYDMHGNVWEWAEGEYGGVADPVPVADRRKDTEPRRTLRGGSWRSDPSSCESANRLQPDGVWVDFGFRVCVRPE